MSLHRAGWFRSHYVDQASLVSAASPSLASRVVGLLAYATTSRFYAWLLHLGLAMSKYHRTHLFRLFSSTMKSIGVTLLVTFQKDRSLAPLAHWHRSLLVESCLTPGVPTIKHDSVGKQTRMLVTWKQWVLIRLLHGMGRRADIYWKSVGWMAARGWASSLEPQDPHGRRRGATQASCPLVTAHTRHVLTPPLFHTRMDTN